MSCELEEGPPERALPGLSNSTSLCLSLIPDGTCDQSHQPQRLHPVVSSVRGWERGVAYEVCGGGGRFLSKAQPCPVCSWSCEDWLSVPGRPTSLHPEVPCPCLDESLAVPVPASVCGMCIVYTFMAQHVHMYTVGVCTIEPVCVGTCVCMYTRVCQAVCGT